LLIRVIQASLREHVVSVRLTRHMLVRKLDFASATPYQAISRREHGRARGLVTPRTRPWACRCAPTRSTRWWCWTGPVICASPTWKTAAGSAIRPEGGAATGLGGTAPRPASSPVPWLAVIGTGLLIASTAVRGFRRIRKP